jgi:TRAP-type C4-dicarboxylate transport system substrate-binding protein
MNRVSFATTAVLAWMAAAGPSFARDLSSSDIYGTDTPTVQALQDLAAQIQSRTQGRYRITSFGAGDRDSENFTVGQVKTGALDLARVSVQLFSTSVPSAALLSAPYLFRSNAHLRRVLDGPIGKKILNDLASQGVVGLCFYDLGARSFYSVDKPIRQASDLNGMLVRVQPPGNILAPWLQSFGATPVPMAFSQIGHAFSSHAIGAATGDWVSFTSGKHYAVAKYFSPTEHTRPPGVVIVSQQVWQALTAAEREVFAAAARASVIDERSRLDAYEARARKTAEQAGVQVVRDLQVETFRATVPEFYSRMFPNDAQQELLKQVLAEAVER